MVRTTSSRSELVDGNMWLPWSRGDPSIHGFIYKSGEGNTPKSHIPMLHQLLNSSSWLLSWVSVAWPGGIKQLHWILTGSLLSTANKTGGQRETPLCSLRFSTNYKRRPEMVGKQHGLSPMTTAHPGTVLFNSVTLLVTSVRDFQKTPSW